MSTVCPKCKGEGDVSKLQGERNNPRGWFRATFPP